jgi:hypothetical protein
MRNTSIKLVILSIILLVSASGTVLGYANYTTNGTANSTVKTTVNVTGAPTVTNTANATVTATVVKGTTVSTPEKVVTTAESTYPQDTSVPKTPVPTPKSPGFGSVVSICVLLLAMYMGKRK